MSKLLISIAMVYCFYLSFSPSLAHAMIQTEENSMVQGGIEERVSFDPCARKERWISDACQTLTEAEQVEFYFFLQLLEENYLLKTSEITESSEENTYSEQEWLSAHGIGIINAFELLKRMQGSLKAEAEKMQFLKRLKSQSSPNVDRSRSEVELGLHCGFGPGWGIGAFAGWEKSAFQSGPHLGFCADSSLCSGLEGHLAFRTVERTCAEPLKIETEGKYKVFGAWRALVIGGRTFDYKCDGIRIRERGASIGWGGGELIGRKDRMNWRLSHKVFSGNWHKYRKIRKVEKEIIQNLRRLNFIQVTALMEIYKESISHLFQILNLSPTREESLGEFHPFASVRNLYLYKN